MMGSQNLSGASLIVIFLVGLLTFVQGGQQLRRFLANAHNIDSYQCVHGDGAYSLHNGVVTYHACKCHLGWTGDACDRQIAPGYGHNDHCNNQCAHGTCVGHTDNHGYYYTCKCDQGWHGSHCTQYALTLSTKKQTKPTLKSATSSTYTTTLSQIVTTPTTSSGMPLSALPRCDHVNTISAVAYQFPVANQNAIKCSTGSHTSHEAFVLAECAIPQNPSSWKRGINVMSSCSHSVAIPNITPIATFDNGLYSSARSQSGIFLGCTSSGFKIALQTCAQPPHIVELQVGGSNTNNPNMYYTIS